MSKNKQSIEDEHLQIGDGCFAPAHLYDALCCKVLLPVPGIEMHIKTTAP